MSKTPLTAAIAVAFSLNLAALPAEALTKNQVRKIARQEVQKVIFAPGSSVVTLQGPVGPQGPPGPQGLPGPTMSSPAAAIEAGLRFASISSNGTIHGESHGIEQQDVTILEQFNSIHNRTEFTYCINPAESVNGAQVTPTSFEDDDGDPTQAFVTVIPDNPQCRIFVDMVGPEGVREFGSFQILLY